MGVAVEDKEYTADDYANFKQKLYLQLAALKEVMAREKFDTDPIYIGAELEMYIIDEQGYVSASNEVLLEELNDKQFQTELNKYNMELNLSAVAIEGKPFSKILNEIRSKVSVLQKIAAKHHVRVVPVGILPTLQEQHLSGDYITDFPRYRQLSKQLLRLKGDKFRVNIGGEEPVSFCCDDVTVEGANTSFQVHLMVGKEQFANTFNAAQMTLSLVTAMGANSPILLGHRVWDETRISLFKQSVDIRNFNNHEWRQPARVSYGHGWVRKSAYELYAEAVSLFEPLFPQITEEDTAKIMAAGGNPDLAELNLHMGTIWPWNRAVYSGKDNGHIRIEFRAIPAGPTSEDMCANAAFAIGLATGLRDDVETLMSVIPFRFAEHNFYRAAQSGIDANILWQDDEGHHLSEKPILEVVKEMLPIASKGLTMLGVDEQESKHFLGIIEDRVQQKMTGARWQKETLRHFEKKLSKQRACREMVKLYVDNTESCLPVSQWPRNWL